MCVFLGIRSTPNLPLEPVCDWVSSYYQLSFWRVLKRICSTVRRCLSDGFTYSFPTFVDLLLSCCMQRSIRVLKKKCWWFHEDFLIIIFLISIWYGIECGKWSEYFNLPSVPAWYIEGCPLHSPYEDETIKELCPIPCKRIVISEFIL